MAGHQLQEVSQSQIQSEEVQEPLQEANRVRPTPAAKLTPPARDQQGREGEKEERSKIHATNCRER